MDSKSLCFFFLVICSPVFTSFSLADTDLVSLLQGGGGGGGGSLPCVQKLLPCQAFLKSSDTPPATCCVPLKEMVANDVKCLCAVFNDPQILKGLNATQEDALNMAKHCGANADTSLCKNATAPTGSTPAAPSSSNSSTTNSSTPGKSSAAVNSYFGVREAAAVLMSFLASSITF